MDAHDQKTRQQESRATADCQGCKSLNETARIEMHQSELLTSFLLLLQREMLINNTIENFIPGVNYIIWILKYKGSPRGLHAGMKQAALY